MKKGALLLILGLIAFGGNSQTNVKLRITHNMNNKAFALDSTVVNDLNHSFNFKRVQYYLSGFKLIHDGGTITNAKDIYLFVDATKDMDYDLGSFTFTQLDKMAFSVGVDTSKNHLDPTSFAANHALSPKSPSMHWGWSSGYRFAALEGMSGTSLSKSWELHGLFDKYYNEIIMPVSSTMEKGGLIITMTADYAMALSQIKLESGVVSHGLEEDDVTMLHNFRDKVFQNSAGETGLHDLKAVNIYAYPSPSKNGKIYFSEGVLQNIEEVVITNSLGQIVLEKEIKLGSRSIDLTTSGMYFISYKKGHKIVNHQKIMVVN